MRREAEVDTQLADLWEQEARAHGRVSDDLQTLQRAVGEKRPGMWAFRDPRQWVTTNEQAEGRARELAAADMLSLRYRSSVLYALEDLDDQRSILEAVRKQAEPLEAEYAATRWSRFFLVQNTGGHVHSSMSCSTTFPTTRWAWLPDLSGLTEADAVADQGPRLCSVCFPSAPVEWTLGLPKAPRCAGSGQHATPFNPRAWKLYGACPVCGDSYAISNSGAIRAHKPKAQA